MTPIARTLAGLAGGWIVHQVIGLSARLHAASGSTGARKLHSRRSFTRNAALGAVGIVVAELAAGTIYLLWPNKTGAFGGEIPLPASSVPGEPGGEPFRYSEGKFYVIRTDDGVGAVYWRCVHLGCTVPYIAGQQSFICPCHGSVYKYNGERVSGPAPKSLDAMPVTVNDDGSIVVDTNPSSLISRQLYDPSNVTPYP